MFLLQSGFWVSEENILYEIKTLCENVYCILEGKRRILHNFRRKFCILRGKGEILHNCLERFCIFG